MKCRIPGEGLKICKLSIDIMNIAFNIKGSTCKRILFFWLDLV